MNNIIVLIIIGVVVTISINLLWFLTLIKRASIKNEKIILATKRKTYTEDLSDLVFFQETASVIWLFQFKKRFHRLTPSAAYSILPILKLKCPEKRRSILGLKFKDWNQ